MKTFNVNGNMTIVIDKINFVRAFSNASLDDTKNENVEWFVEVNFGMMGGFRIPYPDEESAKACHAQIMALIEESK